MNPFTTGPYTFPGFNLQHALRIILGVVILVIVAISPHLASAEADKCDKPGKHLSQMRANKKPIPMPETPFFDANDKPINISDYKGRGVVMNFWATWCVPCVKEMPDLSKLKESLAGSGIEVLALSIDRNGAKVASKFLTKNKITNLDVLIDKKSAVLRANRIAGLPTTLLIDAEGGVRGRVQGIVEWNHDDVIDFLKRSIGPGKS